MIDWQELFIPTHPILEIILRGTLTYIMLFLILRFFLKRQSGVIGIADLLVIVLIADAAQNAMASEYKSITEGGILILTIVFWNYVVDWLGYRFPALQRLTRPAPLLLIEDGKMIFRNMRQEMITTEELNSQLRQQGVEHSSEVKRAYIEGDGSISIIRKDKGETGSNDSSLKGIA
ncbi:MAG: YetF domain-containing protein [Microvirga sp.]